MKVTFESVDDLARALQGAVEAPGRYEEQARGARPQWPTWCVGHMMRTLGEEVQELSGSDAP